MLPSRDLFNAMFGIVVLNGATIGANDPDTPKMKCIGAEYTDNINLVVGDLTLLTAEFDNPALIPEDDSNWVVGDPVNSDLVWQRAAGAGIPTSFKSSSTGLPFTVFGVALLSNDEATLYATQHLTDPITFTLAAQGFDAPRIQLKFPRAMFR